MTKIDIGDDKNHLFSSNHGGNKPTASFLLDDLPKTPEEALSEARKVVWPNWINSEPLISAHVDENGRAYLFQLSELLKNRVVLLDIWDHTLLPSLRALSYTRAWHKRYASSGLITIGIHTPAFEFCKDKKSILDAVRDLDIGYPVVMDNDYAIWRSLENRYWPRRVLLDAQGKIAKDVTGEGDYVDFEQAIQALLRQLSPGLACPPPLKLLRDSDHNDYERPVTTPEVFLGIKRNPRIGNKQTARAAGEEILFTNSDKDRRLADIPYFGGMWVTQDESMMVSIPNPNAKNPYAGPTSLSIKFTGSDVYIVASAKAKVASDVPQGVKIQFFIDEKPVAEDFLGSDAKLGDGRRNQLLVRDPKLYHLATRLEHKEHELKLQIDVAGTDTFQIYALFFEGLD